MLDSAGNWINEAAVSVSASRGSSEKVIESRKMLVKFLREDVTLQENIPNHPKTVRSYSFPFSSPLFHAGLLRILFLQASTLG